MDTTEYRQMFIVDDRVKKTNGDYSFIGNIMTAFPKRSGKWRYVVENDEGILHIFSGKQLEKV